MNAYKLALPTLLRLLTALGPAIVFLGLWQWFVSGVPRRTFLFGSPFLVYQVAVAELPHSRIWGHVGTTASEALLGLAAGSLAGTLAGVAIWGNKLLARVARPYIVVLGTIPVFAIAPMLIIWFGTGIMSKVFMAAFAVFFVSLAHAFEGAEQTAHQHSDFVRSIGAPYPVVARKIIFPGALAWVVTGLKINVGFALMGAFIGEFVSSEQGLGHYILSAGSLYDMPRVLFGILLMSLLALVCTSLIWAVERRYPQFFQR